MIRSDLLRFARYAVQYRQTSSKIATDSKQKQDASTSLSQTVDVKNLKPVGSALFFDNPLFTPVTHPDPVFDWVQLEQSLKVRQLSLSVDFNELKSLKVQMDELETKIHRLDCERKKLMVEFDFVEPADQIKIRLKAKVLRRENTSCKHALRDLSVRFYQQFLSLPNSIHSSCSSGSEPRLLRSITPTSKKSNFLTWSQVEDDLHKTPIGEYLTGLLSETVRKQLDSVREFWSNGSYLVNLSDFARGPAVEGTGWCSVQSALRLNPSRSDLLSAPDELSGDSNWFINPHTTTYLVGSASLASFTAFLMLHRLTSWPPDASSLRLVTLGSVYCKSREIDQPSSEVAKSSPFKQTRQVSLLELTDGVAQCECGFHRLVDELCTFWSNYQPNWPISLISLPARLLNPCEQNRFVLQVEINGASIPLASVSLLSDWIARRVCVRLDNRSQLSGADPYAYMVYTRVVDSQSLLEAFKETGSLNTYFNKESF